MRPALAATADTRTTYFGIDRSYALRPFPEGVREGSAHGRSRRRKSPGFQYRPQRSRRASGRASFPARPIWGRPCLGPACPGLPRARPCAWLGCRRRGIAGCCETAAARASEAARPLGRDLLPGGPVRRPQGSERERRHHPRPDVLHPQRARPPSTRTSGGATRSSPASREERPDGLHRSEAPWTTTTRREPLTTNLTALRMPATTSPPVRASGGRLRDRHPHRRRRTRSPGRSRKPAARHRRPRARDRGRAGGTGRAPLSTWGCAHRRSPRAARASSTCTSTSMSPPSTVCAAAFMVPELQERLAARRSGRPGKHERRHGPLDKAVVHRAAAARRAPRGGTGPSTIGAERRNASSPDAEHEQVVHGAPSGRPPREPLPRRGEPPGREASPACREPRAVP